MAGSTATIFSRSSMPLIPGIIRSIRTSCGRSCKTIPSPTSGSLLVPMQTLSCVSACARNFRCCSSSSITTTCSFASVGRVTTGRRFQRPLNDAFESFLGSVPDYEKLFHSFGNLSRCRLETACVENVAYLPDEFLLGERFGQQTRLGAQALVDGVIGISRHIQNFDPWFFLKNELSQRSAVHPRHNHVRKEQIDLFGRTAREVDRFLGVGDH